jgi:hypothetical protein
VNVERLTHAYLRCPFCHDALDMAGARRACGRCAASHHPECWGEGGGCATCGLAWDQNFQVPGEQVGEEARPGLGLLALVTSMACIVLGAITLARGVMAGALWLFLGAMWATSILQSASD